MTHHKMGQHFLGAQIGLRPLFSVFFAFREDLCHVCLIFLGVDLVLGVGQNRYHVLNESECVLVHFFGRKIVPPILKDS